jgi:hypothetical protein
MKINTHISIHVYNDIFVCVYIYTFVLSIFVATSDDDGA